MKKTISIKSLEVAIMLINLVPCRGGKRILRLRIDCPEYTVSLIDLALVAAVLWAVKLLFRIKYKKRF